MTTPTRDKFAWEFITTSACSCSTPILKNSKSSIQFQSILNCLNRKACRPNAILIALVLCSCTWNKQRLSEQVVINVNGQQLNLKEYSERLSRHLKEFDAIVARSPQQIQRSRDFVIKEFILSSLLDQYANESGVSLNGSEIDEEMTATRAGYPDDLSFRKMLAEENLALAEWKENVRRTVLQRKVFKALGSKSPQPTAEDLRKYYDENKEKFQYKERILLRQIVVDDLGKAQDILDEIKKHQSFESLAKKYSVAPERKAGGLVGWVDRGTVDIFEKAFALPAGGTSPILESAFGFHIFKVEKKEPGGYKKFEDARNLVEQLYLATREQRDYTQWLDQQIRKSKVSINYDLMNQVKVETRIQE
ncbi:MAG: parvulin peptidyl-prolyl isomerase [Bdellovibrio sp.]|nr:MAG: parvulin peptidyl-prolyl isomerase [Bdellovibrio sp.]